VMEDPPLAVAGVKNSQIGALGITTASMRAAYEWSSRVRLGLGYEHRDQRSRDTNVLAWVPPQDRTLEATARYRSEQGVFGLALARREAFAHLTSLRLVWSKQTERAATGLNVGLNQPSVESNVLRLAGKKDVLEGTFNYRLTKYDTLNSSFRVERFASQNGVQLGAGRVASLEYTHALRLDYPDMRARAFVTSSQYTNTGANDPTFAVFYPDGRLPSPELVVPQSATVGGLGLSLGTSTDGRYTRAWRPFMDLALVKNSVIGQGSIARFGLTGSVIGTDRLSFYFNYARGVRGSNDVTREFDVRYAW
jgi:polysaccharide biosynthesis protein PelB